MKDKKQVISGYPIRYLGNVLWPILFLIIYFPVGLLLLLLNLAIEKKGVFYSLHYRGSQGWLIFWTIVFFPIAIILAIIKGFDIVLHE